MTWTKLDDSFWANPKVTAAGNEAAGAYVRMLSYCGQHLTDGRVPEGVARFIAKPKTIARMEEFSLIVRNGSGYLIPDYLEFNPARAEVESKKAVRAEAGRRGGIASGRSRTKQKAKQ